MIIVFTLIYLVSLVIHILITYREHKYIIFKVGDLIDMLEFYMWFPLINTMMLLLLGIAVTIVKIANLLRLSILWGKFRNIKLK